MHSYSIFIRFRGRNIPATVHQYDSFSFVYINDSEIQKDFGSRHEFDIKNNPQDPKTGGDAADFYRAIKDQLR